MMVMMTKKKKQEKSAINVSYLIYRYMISLDVSLDGDDNCSVAIESQSHLFSVHGTSMLRERLYCSTKTALGNSSKAIP
jgi:hypothetical protein